MGIALIMLAVVIALLLINAQDMETSYNIARKREGLFTKDERQRNEEIALENWCAPRLQRLQGETWDDAAKRQWREIHGNTQRRIQGRR